MQQDTVVVRQSGRGRLQQRAAKGDGEGKRRWRIAAGSGCTREWLCKLKPRPWGVIASLEVQRHSLWSRAPSLCRNSPSACRPPANRRYSYKMPRSWLRFCTKRRPLAFFPTVKRLCE